MNLKLSTTTAAQLAEERYFADCKFRGITPDQTAQPGLEISDQCQGKPLPSTPQRVKLSHVWWISDTVNDVESCGKQECLVCGEKAVLDGYTVRA